MKKLLLLFKILIMIFVIITGGYILGVVFFTSSSLEAVVSKIDYAPIREMFTNIALSIKVMTTLITITLVLSLLYQLAKTKAAEW